MLLAVMLTVLSLAVGYLTLGVGNALFYAAWLGSSDLRGGSFLAIALLCSFGFATLSGWLTALIAQRRPIAHIAALVLMSASIWSLYTVGRASLQGPLWAALLNLCVGAAGIVAGGLIQSRQSRQATKRGDRYSGAA